VTLVIAKGRKAKVSIRNRLWTFNYIELMRFHISLNWNWFRNIFSSTAYASFFTLHYFLQNLLLFLLNLGHCISLLHEWLRLLWGSVWLRVSFDTHVHVVVDYGTIKVYVVIYVCDLLLWLIVTAVLKIHDECQRLRKKELVNWLINRTLRHHLPLLGLFCSSLAFESLYWRHTLRCGRHYSLL
jgi:hypothetical protein